MAIKFEDLPPQVQNQLRQLQQLQQQIELLIQQKLQVEIRLRDTEDALEELNKLEENADVYKGVGNLIIKSEKSKLIKELQEEKESLEIRKKTMEAQENRLRERINDLQSKIQEALKTTQ
ncbi:MAG: prefoldin subunit beta [Thermoplasmatales archaeon]|nr:prefoldin subunit beta [Thermoplasmatales archaeon]